MKTSKHKQKGFWGFLGAVAGGLLASDSQEDANQQNAELSRENNAFNAAEAEKNRAFQTEQNAKAMEFNSAQSATQYQRAVADMKAAGINPMMAAMKGGNTAASGVTSAGSAASSAGLPRMEAPWAKGVQAASQAYALSNMAAQNDLLEAQTYNVKSDALVKQAQIGEIEARTARERFSAGESDARTQQIYATLPKIKEEIENLKANTEHTYTKNALTGLQQNVAETLDKLQKQQINESQAKEYLTRVQAEIANLQREGYQNMSEVERTKFGEIMRYIDRITNNAPLIRNIR